MSETRAHFWELLGDLDTLSMKHLGPALYEIGSGTKSFGERDEWTDWFHHILAQTLPRAHESYAFRSLVESLATTFFLLYPEGVTREPYSGFRRDALDTLGRSMMNAECWEGDRIRMGAFLHRHYNQQTGAGFWSDASGDFTASMFFCLKYLEPEEIPPWLRSVLTIADAHWRSQIIAWFVGAHDLLAGRILDPSGYEVTDRRPRIF